MATKKRILEVYPSQSSIYYVNNQPTYRTSSPVTCEQITVTSNNQWPPTGGPVVDRGSNFTTVKGELFNSTPGDYTTIRTFGNQYIGPYWAANPQSALTGAMALATISSDVEMNLKGTKAIRNCIPTKPTVSIGTALGELKDGFPKLVGAALLKSELKDARRLGDEYLNIEFGIKPLLSDIQKTATAVMDSKKILDQLQRDSGRLIRRRYTFPVETSSISTSGTANYGYVPGGGIATRMYSGPGTLLYTETVSVKTWFAGAFTYYLDLGEDLNSKYNLAQQQARKMFGGFTPDTLWELAPWSWLVDWGTNVGDIISNVSAFQNDGLVMPYAYIMSEKTVERTYTLVNGGLQVSKPSPPPSFSVKAIRKQRQRATPFGFGVDMGSLTGRQNAILGALGLSRWR